MTSESILNSIPKIKTAARPRVDDNAFQSAWSIWHAGAALGLAGGFLAVTAGLLLTVLAWFAGNEIAASQTGQFGTWLIIAMFPLMMFGAHSLDKIERAEKAIRLARCRQAGMTDESCR